VAASDCRRTAARLEVSSRARLTISTMRSGSLSVSPLDNPLCLGLRFLWLSRGRRQLQPPSTSPMRSSASFASALACPAQVASPSVSCVRPFDSAPSETTFRPVRRQSEASIDLPFPLIEQLRPSDGHTHFSSCLRSMDMSESLLRRTGDDLDEPVEFRKVGAWTSGLQIEGCRRVANRWL
jgi:hypothetical protein